MCKGNVISFFLYVYIFFRVFVCEIVIFIVLEMFNIVYVMYIKGIYFFILFFMNF